MITAILAGIAFSLAVAGVLGLDRDRGRGMQWRQALVLVARSAAWTRKRTFDRAA